MGCAASSTAPAKQAQQTSAAKDDDDDAPRGLTRSNTLTTVSSTRGRKASSSYGMPYLIDYGRLGRSVDDEIEELRNSFVQKAASDAGSSNGATSPVMKSKFQFGDVELSQSDLARIRLERFLRAASPNDRGNGRSIAPLSRIRSVFTLNDFSITEDELLGAPVYDNSHDHYGALLPELWIAQPMNLPGYSRRIRALAALGDGGVFVAPAESESTYKHVANGVVMRKYPDQKQIKTGVVDRVVGIAVSKNEEKFAVLHADGAVALRDVYQDEISRSNDLNLIPDDSNGPPTSIAITPTGDVIIVGDTSGHLRMYCVVDRKATQEGFQKHGAGFRRASVNSIDIAAIAFDGLGAQRGSRRSSQGGGDDADTAAGPDSAAASGAKKAKKEIAMPAHLCMTAGGDNVVLMWRTTTPEEDLAVYGGHDGGVKAAYFLTDGRTAVSCDDKSVHLWRYDVPTNSLSPALSQSSLSVQSGARTGSLVTDSSPTGAGVPNRRTTPMLRWSLAVEVPRPIATTKVSNERLAASLGPDCAAQSGSFNASIDGTMSPAQRAVFTAQHGFWNARRGLFGPTGVPPVYIFTCSAVYRPAKGQYAGFVVADTTGGLHVFTIYESERWKVWSSRRSAPLCALSWATNSLLMADVFGNVSRAKALWSPSMSVPST